MDPSVVAVAGTLAGVLVSATAAILGALIAGRNQRAIASGQAEHERGRADRDERRRAFVAFLDAYDAAFTAGERLAATAG